ncbi:protein FAM217B [Latimeria chalumnae]|uniref:protein FAM217B n=1 Tax=Latimeria chalumnae TaxID=7897 RepID=UPI0003C1A934|nr:PREDICTED: protein FAM217B isoform X2 [Latimeria chalumnae]|eukprot:XP_005993643.1 PREDICTED: protein FAM217B isoform X2 [Latimeria chalumnae]
MGPDIRDRPTAATGRGTQKEKNKATGARGSAGSKREKGCLNNKVSKRPVSQAKPSLNKINKDITSSTQESFQSTVKHTEQNHFPKEWNKVGGPALNKLRNPSTMCKSTNKEKGSKKKVIGGKVNERRTQEISSSFTCGLGNPSEVSEHAENVLSQSFCCNNKAEPSKVHPGMDAEPKAGSFKCPNDSTEKMFLDFEALRMLNENIDDDSASDLSDSERIALHPSPCTPPELNLRAEEIDPVYLVNVSDQEFTKSEFYYPDFLPPPFNSWDLQQLAIFLNTEGKHATRPQPAGVFEKYVDRLLQMEWLQMQTIQSEKERASRPRPQSAPSSFRSPKSPGKSKPWQTPVPTRVPSQGVAKFFRSSYSNCRVKYPYCSDKCNPYTYQIHSRLPTMMDSALPPQKRPSSETRVKSKTRRSENLKQDVPSLQAHGRNSGCKVQSAGNIRPQKQSCMLQAASVALLKGVKVHASENVKKNSFTKHAYVSTKSTSTERKSKPITVRQSASKF